MTKAIYPYFQLFSLCCLRLSIFHAIIISSRRDIMDFRIGDIVIAKNRHGKQGKYIISKFGKLQQTYRGILVVQELRDDEPLTNVVDLGFWGCALLKVAYSDLYTSEIIELYGRLGAPTGHEVEARLQQFRAQNYKTKSSNRIYCFKSKTNIYSTCVNKMYRGGLSRPK